MVELLLPKQTARVRFPSAPPHETPVTPSDRGFVVRSLVDVGTDRTSHEVRRSEHLHASRLRPASHRTLRYLRVIRNIPGDKQGARHRQHRPSKIREAPLERGEAPEDQGHDRAVLRDVGDQGAIRHGGTPMRMDVLVETITPGTTDIRFFASNSFASNSQSSAIRASSPARTRGHSSRNTLK